MKKILLSSFLIFSFAGYIIYGRTQNSPAPALSDTTTNVVKPQTVQTNTQTRVDDEDSEYNDDDDLGYEVIPPKPVTTQTVTQTTNTNTTTQTGKFKNGQYTGDVADANYGLVQVVATISGGKLTDVKFLDYPQDRPESLRKSTRAMPILISEAIAIQDSNVDTVSGASFTSAAYRESLASALIQAKI